MQHENLANYIWTYNSEDQLLFARHISKYNLTEWLNTQPNEYEKFHLLKKITYGLQHLLSNNVGPGNLKAENILVSRFVHIIMQY
jgi:serine/threonine protein kinase